MRSAASVQVKRARASSGATPLGLSPRLTNTVGLPAPWQLVKNVND
jgi:hypothetical protein